MASTPAFLSKCTKAFSLSSGVENPLWGITGSSGRLGRAGRILVDAKGSPPVWGPTAPSVPLRGWLVTGSGAPANGFVPGVNAGGAVIRAGLLYFGCRWLVYQSRRRPELTQEQIVVPLSLLSQALRAVHPAYPTWIPSSQSVLNCQKISDMLQ